MLTPVELAMGITPPRMAKEEGGRKTVECSWRGKRGIGARVVHWEEGGLDWGWGRAAARVNVRRKGAEKTEKSEGSFIVVGIWN